MASRRYGTLRLAGCVAVLGLLACLLPMAAAAQNQTCLNGVPSICVFNSGGQGTYAGGGFHMDGSNGSMVSTLNEITGVGGTISGTNLGTLSLTTGAFTPFVAGENMSHSGTLGDGSLTIINTTPYNSFSGTLFAGTLTNITWIADGKNPKNNMYTYTLSGILVGTFEGNQQIGGTTAQIYFQSKTPWTGTGAIQLGSGSTTLVVPEPASMGLMGTGLLSMAFLVRKKMKR